MRRGLEDGVELLYCWALQEGRAGRGVVVGWVDFEGGGFGMDKLVRQGWEMGMDVVWYGEERYVYLSYCLYMIRMGG